MSTELTDYTPITTEQARELATLTGKDAIIIVALDRRHDRVHATTWGRTAPDKTGAAEVSDRVAAELFGERLKTYEDCRLEAGRLKEQVERLRDDQPRVGPSSAPPGYSAEVVAGDERSPFTSLVWARDGERPTAITLVNLPTLFLGVVAQRDNWREMCEEAWADLAKTQAERDQLRAQVAPGNGGA